VSTYSIKDLEQLSGIKAHTLRSGSSAYKLLSPKRTDTNIRFYDDDDLKLILNVALLNDNGFKISKIVSMERPEMREEVMRLTERSLTHDDQIHALTISMIEMDEERFDKILSTNIHKLGFEQTMMNIIYPFMSKIGVLWQRAQLIQRKSISFPIWCGKNWSLRSIGQIHTKYRKEVFVIPPRRWASWSIYSFRFFF